MPKKTHLEEKYISIRGGRVHNLKSIDVDLPRNKLIVVTGLSGSGKSSLAFDILFAEGQRRYVESLSAYARQFLGRLDKPDVDKISGIPPAIAIEQKVNTRNPRSTVGTSTEIYDFLKLLFARIGKTYSPVSGKEVHRHSVGDVIDYIFNLPAGSRIMIKSPLLLDKGRSLNQELEILAKQGFSRIEKNGEVHKIAEILSANDDESSTSSISIIIDRIEVDHDNEDLSARLADSVQTAFYEGRGVCELLIFDSDGTTSTIEFSDRFEADGIQFNPPSVHLFSFNNPVGACPECEGFGSTIGIDEDLVVPNKSLSVFDDAIVCWKGEKMQRWKQKLILQAPKFDFPIHKAYYQLSENEIHVLWSGNQYFKGLNAFFSHLEEKAYKIQYRVMLARYRGKTRCPACNGKRLRPEASYVKINGYAITDLVNLPVDELLVFFNEIKLDKNDQAIAERLIIEIRSRLDYLVKVGLGYLSLNRTSNTLSGGESQRINLASSLGSSLVGSLYILDEPSIGLHPRDTKRLMEVLINLRNLGNTVLVVEHEEEIIRTADHIVDIGPQAGRLGGEIVFDGTVDDLLLHSKGLTAQYLRSEDLIAVPIIRRPWNNYIEVRAACENNLKNLDVKFPLGIMTVVTGVSGSGKSSLVHHIFYSALAKALNGQSGRTGKHGLISGDIHLISSVEMIDQNPIGRSSRSNPATYLKAYDEIRKLFASLPQSKLNGYKPAHYSFNVDGGRCEECQGEGVIKVEMQFMADVYLVCDHCKGKRFKDEILSVKYHGLNVHDILDLTVEEAIAFFHDQEDNQAQRIATKLQPLMNVGLGYVKLGQSSSTLSGGESQRIKLASFLSKGHDSGKTLFIFDEPTTGLHFHDIKVLLSAFNALLDRGHTVLIIEHNPEIIKSADWVIDLGPEGGEKGGELVFAGTPEELINCTRSYTGKYLRKKL
ncbi:MAG: excinuclease ABC subunit UvrA [Bacteroidales bacterium]|nr:excinuclease ABC subunit UvrA [Bacteroidales bacterium]